MLEQLPTFGSCNPGLGTKPTNREKDTENMRPHYRAGSPPKTQFLRHLDEKMIQLIEQQTQHMREAQALRDAMLEFRVELRHTRDILDKRNRDVAELEARLDWANAELANRGNPHMRRIPRLVMNRQWLCSADEGGESHHAVACREGRIVLKKLHRDGFGIEGSTLEEPRIPVTPSVLFRATRVMNRDAWTWILNGLERTTIRQDHPHMEAIRRHTVTHYQNQTEEQHERACLALLALQMEFPDKVGLQDGTVWAERPATNQEKPADAPVPVDEYAELPEQAAG